MGFDEQNTILGTTVSTVISKDDIIDALKNITTNSNYFDACFWSQFDIDQLEQVISFLKREVNKKQWQN